MVKVINIYQSFTHLYLPIFINKFILQHLKYSLYQLLFNNDEGKSTLKILGELLQKPLFSKSTYYINAFKIIPSLIQILLSNYFFFLF